MFAACVSGARCDRKTHFAALLNGVRILRSVFEKRSRPALRAENVSRLRRSAVEKRSGPSSIIEIGLHPDTYLLWRLYVLLYLNQARQHCGAGAVRERLRGGLIGRPLACSRGTVSIPHGSI